MATTQVHTIVKTLGFIGRILLRVLYFLTGLYFPEVKRQRSGVKCFFISYFIIFSCVICIFTNALPTILFFLGVVFCSKDNYHLCYSLLPQTRSIDEKDKDINATIDNVVKFQEYGKIVLLVSSFSGSISYLVFIIIFVKLYVWPTCQFSLNSFFFNQSSDLRVNQLVQPLNPFNDDYYESDERKSACGSISFQCGIVNGEKEPAKRRQKNGKKKV